MTNSILDDLYMNFFKNRGVGSNVSHEIDEEKHKFLNPDFEKHLHDPFDFTDMHRAVDRLHLAIQNKEKILIYTDYDCDGIPAGVILYDFLTKIKDNLKDRDLSFINYIPHRHNEGYGLHAKVIEKFAKEGYTLMITADLGITNIKEVDLAEKLGINVILTDHHLPLHTLDQNGNKIEELPKPFALINTQLQREKYINKNICGAGTAWKLVNAFLVKHGENYGIPAGWEKWLLDMVALATVADMMELNGENRVLVHYGLKVLHKSKRPGLQRILSIDRIKQLELVESDLSFSIAPRVNAAGRLDHPIKAFYAFSDFEKQGTDYANELEKFNKLRKTTVKDINVSINEHVLNVKDIIVFIGDKSWPVGVVGLVAQKVVETTGKTCFVWGIDEEGIVRGSSRAGNDGINVTDLTASVKEKLITFGGHEAAGGFAFIDGLQEEIRISLLKNYSLFVNDPKSTQEETSNENEISYIDAEINARNVNFELYKGIRALAPFGIGNPAPILKIVGVIKNVREFGSKKEHLELNVDGISLIKFFVSEDEKNKLKSASYWL
jgi:single-stranded-DNA-specific exonuclease